MIRIGRLDSVHNCPLASSIRKRLRRRGVGLDFTCVYSIEPVAHLPKEAIDRKATENEDIVERGRKRGVLGSLPTLTGIFGLTIANTAIKTIIDTLE
jgi:tRNA A37 threonylcarbamoyladenosine dehydratase